ncbi:MAG: DNA topoisomerase 3 [Bacteroidales bacterium]|nr:DNA topoisomerase 3 [Bacteroidales bacterium]MDY2916944.1 DNA topoisomerase 3 [Muribaculaceae bacterium]
MKVCITEKPSVARDIAAILGATSRHDGFFEGNGYCVTWTFGHLCCLKDPGDYTPAWRHWDIMALPMIPPKFGIKLISDPGIEKQFHVIESLIAKADEVINCGDAGQEGELIQRWVMQKAQTHCPVKRLWISSLTDDSIRAGFTDLRPSADYDNLYHAGLSRAIGDWLLGLNATRLYTKKYGTAGTMLSVGRVQTPTLALIVDRHRAITDFKPENFWELKTVYRGATFNATSGRYKTPEDAQKALEAVTGVPLVINSVTSKRGKESPRRLFDLTSLQVECNRRWGWTADESLRLIQSLYEKKVTTYPRVDTTYLTDDIYPKVPDILRRMTPYANVTAPVLAARIPKSKKVFDNSKVTDHHAIIPTGETPSSLVGDERLMYHLIAMRFIAAFYPDCVVDTTTVLARAGETQFRATGKVIASPGWRALEKDKDSDKKDPDEQQTLPEFTQGESGPHEPGLAAKTTQPPKPYTEGTLLRAMETAGKTVDDEELRDAMKENGIGRPSTRAAIIETLFRRRYIRRERKSIAVTQAGIDLIDTIRSPLLKSAKLTGLWENKLRRIERGQYSAAEFIAELKTMITDIVREVLADRSATRIEAQPPAAGGAKAAKKPAATAPAKPRAPRITRLDQVACPLCGQGHILRGRTAYGCSRYTEGCTLRLPFADYPADLKPGELSRRIKKQFKRP